MAKNATAQYRVKANCPDGKYEGLWGGYVLKWEHDGKEVDCILKLGVRGINIPVSFEIKNGVVDEQSIEVRSK